MNRKRVSKKQVESLCGEIHADDGIDPKDYFRPSRKSDSNHRKAQQLCHQVADTLSLVLGGELGEELQNLRVVAVRPAPDATQLLVLVASVIATDPVNPDVVVARLASITGKLRGEVAASITRRRAPKLVFQFVGGCAAEEGAS